MFCTRHHQCVLPCCWPPVLNALFTATAVCTSSASPAEDKREQAAELLELADAVADAADTAATAAPGQPSIGIKLQQKKQQSLASHGAAIAASDAAGTGCGAASCAAATRPGTLPDALTAAQQLLMFGGVHVANIPGLGFAQVVSFYIHSRLKLGLCLIITAYACIVHLLPMSSSAPATCKFLHVFSQRCHQSCLA